MNDDPCQKADKLVKSQDKFGQASAIANGNLIPECAVLDHYPQIRGENRQLIVPAIAGLLHLDALLHSLLFRFHSLRTA